MDCSRSTCWDNGKARLFHPFCIESIPSPEPRQGLLWRHPSLGGCMWCALINLPQQGGTLGPGLQMRTPNLLVAKSVPSAPELAKKKEAEPE